MKVQDYLLSADWCHGLEPTASEGWYLSIMTHQQNYQSK